MDGGAGLQQHECPQCYWTVHLKWVRVANFVYFTFFFFKKKKNNRFFCSWISDLHGVQQQWLLTMLSHHLGTAVAKQPAPPSLTGDPTTWSHLVIKPGPLAQHAVGSHSPQNTRGLQQRGLSTRSKKMVAQASDQLSRRQGRGIHGMRHGDAAGGQHLLKVGLGVLWCHEVRRTCRPAQLEGGCSCQDQS